MLRGFFCLLVMGMLWGCGGEQVMQSQMVEEEEQAGRPLSKLAVQANASQAVAVATVLPGRGTRELVRRWRFRVLLQGRWPIISGRG